MAVSSRFLNVADLQCITLLLQHAARLPSHIPALLPLLRTSKSTWQSHLCYGLTLV